jgi:heme-degrading monooxygenase HmoA
MFSRIVWSQRADPQRQVDPSFFRDKILPSLKTQAGFLGAVVLANAEQTEGLSVTYWDSAEAVTATEAIGAAGRAEAAKAQGLIVTDVDRFEMLLQDRVKPVQAGTFVRMNDVGASPSQIDATLALLRDTMIDKVKSLKGYRALLVGANRATGRMIVSSVWDSAADRQASESVISGLRQQLVDTAKPRSAVRIGLYEGLFADVAQAAQQSTTAKAGAA